MVSEATSTPRAAAERPEDGAPPDLSGRAARGAVWTIAGHGGAQLMRLGGNLVLTRLLAREHFGLMALVMVALQGVTLLSDLGIGPSIVRSKSGDDPRFVNTAWTIQALRGLALAGITCLAAWPMAAFYDEPRLMSLLLVAALVPAVTGFESAKYHLQNRHLALGRIVLIELSSQAIGLTVMIGWALRWPSAAALVAGALTRGIIFMILTHVVLSGIRSRPCWDKRAAKQLLQFGSWILLSTALTYFAGYADRAILGKLVTMSELGVYAIAVIIATAPREALGRINTLVVFPLYSRAVQRGEVLQGLYVRARWPVLVVSSWALAGIIAGGPTAIRILYDDRYWAAGHMVQFLAGGIWFGLVLEGTNGAALLAYGRPRWVAAGSAAKLVGLLIAMPLGFKWGGFLGAIVGLSLAEGCRYLVSTFAARRFGLRGILQDTRATLWLAAGSIAGLLAADAARRHGAPIAVEALAVFAAVTVLWLPLLPALRNWRQVR